MATFSADGIAGLTFSLEEVAKMPVELQDEMLNAGADVLIPAQKAKIRQYGIYDLSNRETRHVADSVGKSKPKVRKGSRVIYVTAKGARLRGEKKTRNAAILYINEFGKRNQKARPAIRDSTEEAAPRVEQAELEVWDKFLTKNNL